MLEAQTVWVISPRANPRKGIRGTLVRERNTVSFTPAEPEAPGFRIQGGEVIAARKAVSSPVIELSLASYPAELLLYFTEPSFFFQDLNEMYKMAWADVFLGETVNEWLRAFLHPETDHVAPEWTTAQQDRLEELERLREQRGLSDDEANELGRLYATRAGEEYENFEGLPHPDFDRIERPWRWADVNTPAEGLAWYAGTAGTKPSELARELVGKRPPPHARGK